MKFDDSSRRRGGVVAFAVTFLSSPLTTFSFTAPRIPSVSSPFAFSHERKNPFSLRASTPSTPFFGEDPPTDIATPKSTLPTTATTGRPLGSQELLMLPRQYSLTESNFPPMSHVSLATLSTTPALSRLQFGLDEILACHPLLRSTITGDGEPTKRIDLFKMVREGNPQPESFSVSPPGRFGHEDVLSVVDVDADDDFESAWRDRFQHLLDRGPEASEETLLWRVEFFRQKGSEECALLFNFNHAISDQSSANLILDHLLSVLSDDSFRAERQTEIPPSLEMGVLGSMGAFETAGTDGFSPKTLAYVAGKAAEGLRDPVILPDTAATGPSEGNAVLNAVTTITGNAAGGESDQDGEGVPGCAGRSSTLQFRVLDAETTSALLARCREEGITVSSALSAAVAYAGSDVIGFEDTPRNYKILQSLDMRRFQGEGGDKCQTVACHAGSMDLMYGPVKPKSGLRTKSLEDKTDFWDVAREGAKQTQDFIRDGQPEEAVRVFDFAMTISDMNNLVHLTAMSEATQGRAYSGGITNVGVYERQLGVLPEDSDERDTLKTRHGPYQINDLFYATSHARSGCLYQVSGITINEQLHFTFHPASPLVSPETNNEFADSFVSLLESVANKSTVALTDDLNKSTDSESSKGLSPPAVLAATVLSLGTALALHYPAWSHFFSNLATMKANATPEDFSAALNFWIFFAVGHPVLQPILWISDVLHSSPGFLVGGLVPVTFLLGNLAVLALLNYSSELLAGANILALSAFLGYVGAGLDNQAGMGDYNLQINDDYKGEAVRGCPTYDQVRLPSMDNFDLEKYQGLWYEQKFHDWTQFKEVYDTSLGIKLTSDKQGWIDDFAVKGPAPLSAPMSWDKSPVANGAHYFLFGRVDSSDPPGVLRESGFGVEFPNYIVDVQKNAEGEYTEAIQFQCLERGGVRVFEGINFMSKEPQMSQQGLTDMHARAKQAGMYPYGAGEEQMHSVARWDPEGGPIDNAWQQMWRAIGLDKLLELLTESIEDGGR